MEIRNIRRIKVAGERRKPFGLSTNIFFAKNLFIDDHTFKKTKTTNLKHQDGHPYQQGSTDYSTGLQYRITVQGSTDYSTGLQYRITVQDYSTGLQYRTVQDYSTGQYRIKVQDYSTGLQ